MKFNEFLKKHWYFLVIGVVILSLAAFGITRLTLSRYEDKDSVTQTDTDNIDGDTVKANPRQRLKLDATKNEATGISLSSAFKLQLPTGLKLSAEEVVAHLEVSPKVDYDIAQSGEGFMVTPKAELIANKVYTFKFKMQEQNIHESWAFQTRRDFKILASLPADKATFVPVNTGIEINFSHSGVTNIEDHFSITPQVNGRFEYHKNTAVFIPGKLEYDTVYTVTLTKGVALTGTDEKIEEDYTFAFQTEKQNRNNQNQSYLDFYDQLTQFPSDREPYLAISASDDFKDKDLELNVYRYADETQFVSDLRKNEVKPYWVMVDPLEFMPDLSRLELYKTLQTKLTWSTEAYSTIYLVLPETLPEGYYVLTVNDGSKIKYVYVQINDTQLFMSLGRKSTLAWAQDMNTASPISDAQIELLTGSAQAVTDNNGVALIDDDVYKDNTNRYFYFKTAREGHPPLISQIYNNEQGSYYYGYSEADRLYWNYMYFDRNAYLPTDTVNVWGLVKPRSDGPSPSKATLELISNIYDSKTYASTEVVLDSKTVEISRNGTYAASFSFENLPQAGYYVKVKVGGKLVSERYFYIDTYVKPQTRLTLNPDKKAVMSGETANVGVTCEFFEGTPVAGMALKHRDESYQANSTAKEGSIVLDDGGTGTVAFTYPERGLPISWQPIYHNIYFSNKDPEETENYANTYVYEFPRDVMIEIAGKLENSQVSLTVKTNKIDLSKIRETGEFFDGGERPLYAGAAVDTKVKGTLYEKYWDRKETGEQYDFINKQTYKTYDYFEVTREIQSFEIDTLNGEATLNIPVTSQNKNNMYYISYEAADTRNRPITDDFYIYGAYDYYSGGYDFDNYELKLNKADRLYAPGENIECELLRSGKPMEDLTQGSILYLTEQEGILDYWVSTGAKQTLPYQESYIPNFYVQAVYFDGKRMHVTYESIIYYDYKTKEVDVTLETDKETYQPGDTVNAAIHVKDKNGNPCKADVNLSVVDEAYFAIYPQDIYLLQGLYKGVFNSGVITTYVSYINYSPSGGGAEGGEGGDQSDNFRSNFVDTAYFSSVETDDRGEATFSFKLPDNLTSWRLTYQAITDDLKAGTSTTNINTKLPFFIKLVGNSAYLEGDQPVMLLKCFGEALKGTETVDYEVTLEGLDGSTETYKASGSPQQFTEVKFQPLKEGTYSLKIKAVCGTLQDAVQRTVRVEKSMLQTRQTDYFNLSGVPQLDSKGAMATLKFYQANLTEYYKALNALYWSYGNRVDQVIAQKQASELLSAYFDEGYDDQTDLDLSNYQKTDGGIALFPYASSDTELSAKIASITTESLNVYQLKDYFTAHIEDTGTTPLQVAASYWGLAALHEPVLNELKAFYESDSFKLDEKLYIALAFAELGDFPTAEIIYDEVVKTYGKIMEPYLYLDTGVDKDDYLRVTSLCAMLATKLDMPQQGAFFGYVESNSPKDLLINLERLTVVKQGLPNVPKQSSFKLTVNGKEETVTLEGTAFHAIMVKASDLATIKFSDIKGNVAAVMSYEGKTEGADNQQTIATIDRIYSEAGQATQTLTRTGLVKVELRVEFTDAAPEGYYSLTDVLPSGLRYVQPYQVDSDDWYFGVPQGQLVKMDLYNDGKKKDVRISYYARVSAPGTYTADRACIRHDESDARGYSESAQITIE